MDYKKAYEDALERAKGIYNENPSSSTAKFVCGQIFPEIKESDDERIRKELLNYILYKAKGISEEQEYSWVVYLEKQKEQNPAGWSEEDKTFLEDALWCVLLIKHFVPKYVCDLNTRISVEKWLKYLPKRLKSIRPQPHWKPSEEQMRVFFKATPVNLMPEEISVYMSLCSDIQKLM